VRLDSYRAKETKAKTLNIKLPKNGETCNPKNTCQTDAQVNIKNAQTQTTTL
jgi:hypothetical protein